MLLSEDFQKFGLTIQLWVFAFILVYMILRRVIPVPDKIAKNPNEWKRKSDFSFYVFSHLSLVHACGSLFFSLVILFRRKLYYEERNQNDTLNLLSFSAGYYLTNTLMGRFHKFHSISMVCHHLIVLLEIFYVFWCGFYGNIITAGFAIAELSNPFRILKNLSDGHENGRSFGRKSMAIFAVVFLICRFE